MKTLFALTILAGSALASLNCTLLVDAVERYCEYDDCPAHGQLKKGDVVHAGCRADCSSDTDLWFKLYNGAFVRADNETVTACKYHSCDYPKAALGLPKCYQEKGASTPTMCEEYKAAVISAATPIVTPLGDEPPEVPGVCKSAGV